MNTFVAYGLYNHVYEKFNSSIEWKRSYVIRVDGLIIGWPVDKGNQL